jgi:hypothetical protein
MFTIHSSLAAAGGFARRGFKHDSPAASSRVAMRYKSRFARDRPGSATWDYDAISRIF